MAVMTVAGANGPVARGAGAAGHCGVWPCRVRRAAGLANTGIEQAPDQQQRQADETGDAENPTGDDRQHLLRRGGQAVQPC